jgi:hypothetical protein
MIGIVAVFEVTAAKLADLEHSSLLLRNTWREIFLDGE